MQGAVTCIYRQVDAITITSPRSLHGTMPRGETAEAAPSVINPILLSPYLDLGVMLNLSVRSIYPVRTFGAPILPPLSGQSIITVYAGLSAVNLGTLQASCRDRSNTFSSLVESIAKSPTVLVCCSAITSLRLQHERSHGLQKCGLAQ